MEKLSKKEEYLHESFVQYGLNVKEWMRKCVLLLPEIHKNYVWRKRGFGSIYEYAGKLAGMSKHTVDDALWIMRKIEDKPELKKVVEKKGKNAVRPVVTIATKATDGFWAKNAMDMSQNTLRTLVKDVRNTSLIDNDYRRVISTIDTAEKSGQLTFDDPEDRSEKVILSMDLSPQLSYEWEKLKMADWDETIKEFLEFRKQALELEKPDPVKT